MPTQSLQDRAAGALMGAFIGDALALGPHWYYDLDELRADYGDWIDGYTDPRPAATTPASRRASRPRPACCWP
jgi:ADP-ribosylglycohydrolase